MYETKAKPEWRLKRMGMVTERLKTMSHFLTRSGEKSSSHLSSGLFHVFTDILFSSLKTGQAQGVLIQEQRVARTLNERLPT